MKMKMIRRIQNAANWQSNRPDSMRAYKLILIYFLPKYDYKKSAPVRFWLRLRPAPDI